MIVRNTGLSVVHRNVLFMLLFLLGAAACTEKTRKNSLHSLSGPDSDDERMEITEDSIINIKIDCQDECQTINIPKQDKEICLDTVFASYSFIPLETTVKSVVGRIEKILVCHDCFCILDRDNSNVLLFELDGQFRCRLGEKGHGPGEHVDAWNVAYDKEKQEIVLLDLAGRKLMYYDLTGNLKSTEPMYYLYTDFEFQKDKMILYTGTSYNEFSDILDLYQLIIAERKQKPRVRAYRVSEDVRHMFSYGARLKKSGDEVIYDDMLSDTLWRISAEEQSPLIAVRFNKGPRFSKEEKRHMTDKLFRERSNQVGSVSDWQVSSDYISLLVRTPETGRRLFNVIYSRKSGKCKVVGNNVEKSRLGDYVTSAAFDGVYDNKSFIRIVEPMDLIRYTEDKRLEKILTAEERKLLEDIKADNNPVLLIERIVDF